MPLFKQFEEIIDIIAPEITNADKTTTTCSKINRIVIEMKKECL